MIIVSDMELGGGVGTVTGGAVDSTVVPGGREDPHSWAGAHLSPGMSSRLVIPVQLMSKIWGGNGVRGGCLDPSRILLGGGRGCRSFGGGEGTHRAPDEEHGEGPHDRHVPKEGLQDDPQHPMELGGCEM